MRVSMISLVIILSSALGGTALAQEATAEKSDSASNALYVELGAGVDVMHFSAGASSFDATASATGVVPVGTATLGYRYAAADGGFLFKAGYTPLFFVTTEEKQVFHWGGMSFGYRF